MRLTAEHRSRYEAQGLVFPLRALSAAEAARYRAECDELERQLGGRPRTIEVRQMHLHFAWAYELATHPSVLDAVEDLLGPDLLIWATELFAKHPQEEAVSIAWHRDGAYMGLDPELTLTAWIALSPSTPENGCLRAVREPSRRQAAGNEAIRARREPARLPPGELIDVALEAGEMSLHDVYLLHGSQSNRSDQKRVGFAVRFTTPYARPLLDRPPAVLARGEDRFGHFQIHEPPRGCNAASALAQMRLSARRHLEATLKNLERTAMESAP